MQKIYKEGRWVAKVEIVEDNSTDSFENYKLRVLENIPAYEPDTILKLDVGKEFEVSWTKEPEFKNFRVWTLSDIKD